MEWWNGFGGTAIMLMIIMIIQLMKTIIRHDSHQFECGKHSFQLIAIGIGVPDAHDPSKNLGTFLLYLSGYVFIKNDFMR